MKLGCAVSKMLLLKVLAVVRSGDSIQWTANSWRIFMGLARDRKEGGTDNRGTLSYVVLF